MKDYLFSSQADVDVFCKELLDKYKGGKMKEEIIKPLPLVKEFSDYFVNRAKKILKLKNSEFKSFGIDIWNSGKNLWVWFYGENSVIVARVTFTADGKKDGDVIDHRKEG